MRPGFGRGDTGNRDGISIVEACRSIASPDPHAGPFEVPERALKSASPPQNLMYPRSVVVFGTPTS